jgi:hypothetical protein
MIPVTGEGFMKFPIIGPISWGINIGILVNPFRASGNYNHNREFHKLNPLRAIVVIFIIPR